MIVLDYLDPDQALYRAIWDHQVKRDFVALPLLLLPDWAFLTAMTEIDCQPEPVKLLGEDNY
ncbi:hypothetical protein AWM75_07830 [Aerococcus urinaehominis]|uniref:Uncharacterized protein n=1 Tax=Aerococcus urinaehominis TaxID=128944 RepID=A0A120IB25_9LACT|nr:hypothetical protein [Aerococcus urinaehominis]AMB99881.1 hypothetical protein AWM75_07830 [Aerococcus urinaehominis]SDM53201.1 hypothetical protein SAMN04487985_12130 [Aerococcus urinaehominis]